MSCVRFRVLYSAATTTASARSDSDREADLCSWSARLPAPLPSTMAATTAAHSVNGCHRREPNDSLAASLATDADAPSLMRSRSSAAYDAEHRRAGAGNRSPRLADDGRANGGFPLSSETPSVSSHWFHALRRKIRSSPDGLPLVADSNSAVRSGRSSHPCRNAAAARADRRKPRNEERNVDECPPTGGKPHRHRRR